MRNGAYGAGTPIPEIAGFNATVSAANIMVMASGLVFIYDQLSMQALAI